MSNLVIRRLKIDLISSLVLLEKDQGEVGIMVKKEYLVKTVCLSDSVLWTHIFL